MVLSLLILASAFAAPAQARYASMVIDAYTGRVLHSANADTRNYPASLTKMMTLYLVFDGLKKGRVKLKQKLPVSARAARQPASRLGLKRGQSITVEQAILALVTKSANDVATVVAEGLSGSERQFARKMTLTARALGMTRTTFRNASGLPNRGQMSTARDMAVLARSLLKHFPREYRYFSTASFTHRGIRHKNHNKLLVTYEGVDGIKTGYIRASGFNLVTSAKRGNQRLIGVVFGGDSSRSRNRHMTKLLNKGFKKLAVASTAAPSRAKARTKAATPRRARNSGQWGVQVGAYRQYASAHDAARKAVNRLPSVLGDGSIEISTYRKRKKNTLYYRGRIIGIERSQAYRACRLLKRQNIPCMAIQAKDAQVAAAR
jgi:D-alanyl-D-alanine carboxypeptidase